MKQEYLHTSLLFLAVYFCWRFQMCTARHHPHAADGCRRCAPGFGVTHHCSRRHDTECGACAPGLTYSGHHSARRPCYPCSRCGPGLYVAHPCTPTRDTVCDSCHTYKGPHNQDYYRKCVEPLVRAKMAPLTKEKMGQSSPSPGVPTYIVILSGMGIGFLGVTLVAAFFVASFRRRCKKVDHRYAAVATQEAVML